MSLTSAKSTMNPILISDNSKLSLSEFKFETNISVLINELLQLHNEVKKIAKEKIGISVNCKKICSMPDGADQLIADLSGFQVEEAFLRQTMLKICDLEQKAVKNKAIEIGKIRSAIDNDQIDFMLLRLALLNKNNYITMLQDQFGIDSELILSISLNTFRPVFDAALENGGADFNESVWGRNQCPACGAHPAMARLEKETGRRKLWCAICNSQWTFKRTQCPFCLNEKQELLNYFYLDDDGPYRVDICRICKSYIKTVVEANAEPWEVVFLVEDLNTSHLDIMARQEGFN